MRDDPMFYFGITLMSRQVCADWSVTMTILQQTIRSILAQGPDARILIACHEPPDLPAHPSITNICVDFPLPRTKPEKYEDRGRKYFALGMHLKRLGGGWLMPVDYDDLLSRNLLTYVRRHPNPNGYVFSYGWVMDADQSIYPLPLVRPESGRVARFLSRHLVALDDRFDRRCGTCAMFAFARDELPSHPAESCRFSSIFAVPHGSWKEVSEAIGRPLSTVPERLVTYVAGIPNSMSIELSYNIFSNGGRRTLLRRFLAVRLSPQFREEFALA